MFIEILFKMLLFKGGVLIYAEHYIYIYIYYIEKEIYTIIYDIQEPFGIFYQVRAQCLPLFLRGG